MRKSERDALEWHESLLTSCGVGLWSGALHDDDAKHPLSRWEYSQELRRILGFAPSDPFPNSFAFWSDTLHPDDTGPTFAAFDAAMASGGSFDLTFRMRCKDGEYRYFRSTGGVILDAKGKVRRTCGSLTDIDQAKRRANDQNDAVRQLTDLSRHLAAGNLTMLIDAGFPQSMAGLKDDLNGAIDKLGTSIGSISGSAAAIRTGAGEIAQASEDLARRTESAASALEQTAASLTVMDGRLKASAASSARTVERADQAIATVGGGRAVADQAVEAMGRVSDSAKGIDSVIEGLDKIAFQTRVLAMNAAVEAGRAGDAGRGFAVVADLVSALAMRAEEEAKRARDQLTVTQTDIVTAVDAVQKVDGALADISGDVAQVHELLATMAADNQAQATAITQISSAIVTMERSTQQNAAMVEETSAAARNLSHEVTSLAEQTGLFVVPGAAGGAAPRALPAPPVAPPRTLARVEAWA